ncbi:ABC transporter ATP-binding protein [Sphingomonas sp.]|uniref:ABC transporter ATP-binding protein n=1 Tax=Sphingomonas sp. TaxID=28214 RepID=UPI0025F0B9B5|nr:ABC transporter ATP-binding protein [Sphingomonas sp.]
MAAHAKKSVRMRDFLAWARPILWPDKQFFYLAIVYGIAISLLSLATPISVQLLINSIAYTAMPVPLFTLALLLFGLLMATNVLSAFRTHIMEIFRRKFFARLVAEITMRAVHARDPFFSDARRADLFNRYFDVMNVQKSIPSLLVGLFTIVLQSAVGFVVTSIYHPFFLVFNLVFIALVWIIWRVWSRPAMTEIVALSHAKYDTAHWLESVGASNGFYKSGRHIDYAIHKSDELTATYIAADRRYFGNHFTQHIFYLTLYAAASAGLLALGGWLVIQGQLSIGQLVAAELILSSIFYGASQLGPYLESFYELVAACEELHLFMEVPQESRTGKTAPHSDGAELCLADVKAGDIAFDFTIPQGKRLVAAAEPDVQRTFALLLKRHRRADAGFVTLGGADISALDIYQLRSDVIVLDKPTTVESSIFDYLDLATGDATPAEMMEAIKLVGLDRQIGRLPDGIQTVLSTTGWPLALPDVMRLKFAAATLARPRILVLSPLFDMIARPDLERMLAAFNSRDTTMIYFTNRATPPVMDGYFWLGRDRQALVASQTEFDALRYASEAPNGDR